MRAADRKRSAGWRFAARPVDQRHLDIGRLAGEVELLHGAGDVELEALIATGHERNAADLLPSQAHDGRDVAVRLLAHRAQRQLEPDVGRALRRLRDLHRRARLRASDAHQQKTSEPENDQQPGHGFHSRAPSDHGDLDPARAHGAVGRVATRTDRLQLNHELVIAEMPRAAETRKRRGQIDRRAAAFHGHGRRHRRHPVRARSVLHVLGAEEAEARHVVRVVDPRARGKTFAIDIDVHAGSRVLRRLDVAQHGPHALPFVAAAGVETRGRQRIGLDVIADRPAERHRNGDRPFTRRGVAVVGAGDVPRAAAREREEQVARVTRSSGGLPRSRVRVGRLLTGDRGAHHGAGALGRRNRLVPFGDADALYRFVNRKTAMVILEPIQGENGVIVPPNGYLKKAREICDKYGALLTFDCVQTGMGRTGEFFGFEDEKIMPDIITLAKGLGGGLPIGAMIAIGPAAHLFQPGDHGSTFGGNPISSASGLAVLKVIKRKNLQTNARKIGKLLSSEISRISGVSEVRGKGLLIGVGLTAPKGAEIVEKMMAKGVLVNSPNPNTIRIAPPLIIDQADAKKFIKTFKEVMANG